MTNKEQLTSQDVATPENLPPKEALEHQIARAEDISGDLESSSRRVGDRIEAAKIDENERNKFKDRLENLNAVYAGRIRQLILAATFLAPIGNAMAQSAQDAQHTPQEVSQTVEDVSKKVDATILLSKQLEEAGTTSPQAAEPSSEEPPLAQQETTGDTSDNLVETITTHIIQNKVDDLKETLTGKNKSGEDLESLDRVQKGAEILAHIPQIKNIAGLISEGLNLRKELENIPDGAEKTKHIIQKGILFVLNAKTLGLAQFAWNILKAAQEKSETPSTSPEQ